MSQITRRQLLIGTAGFAYAPFLRQFEPRLRFVFFSDTHVGLKSNVDLNREMLSEIGSHRPAFAINGGDVTDYGWVGEYDNWRTLLREVPFKVHHIAGNHDVRWSPLGPKAYREGTGDPMYSKFDHSGCHFVLLDSTVPLSHYGHFESEQLRWLEADLKTLGRETPVLIFTHHWVGRDRMMADNEAALLKVIEPYNVKMVFNGHGHSDLLWSWNDIPGTMNKGLYQGSYQVVDVGPEQVVIYRRTTQKPSLVQLTQIPLKPSRDKRRVWKIAPTVVAGQVVTVPGGFDQARWGDGPWISLTENAVPTTGLIAGTSSLSLRKGKDSFVTVGATQVQAPSGKLRKRWETELSGGVMSHLREVDGVLYVSAMDGSLSALSTEDGRKLWTARTSGYCHSSPTVHERTVYVGSADGSVYAFDQGSGERRWRTATGGPVYASATVAKGVLVIASGDGSIYGLDPKDGRKLWRYDLPKSNTSFIQSPAATDGERVYLGAWDKFLYCLDPATGKLNWRQDCVGERSFAYSPAIGGPCVGDQQVFVPANGNLLWAFHAQTGEKVWSISSPGDKFGYSSPAYADGKVVVGGLGDKGEVRCVDAENGGILWTASTGSVIYDSGPVIADGVAFVGSVAGILSAINMSDGKVLGQYALPTGHFLSTPAARGGRVYAATYSDRCFAFDVG